MQMKERSVIEENVQKWAFKYLPNFQFRQYQLEYITDTLYSLLNGTKLNILEAPTGAGKSIITIIMAGTLDKFYNIKSYILCSDLHLWQQYSDAFDKFNLYFGKLKGIENYICNQTNESYNNAPCKLCRIGFQKLSDNQWTTEHDKWICAQSCNYIKDRRKAINSNVTLLTYQLYLVYMNSNNDSIENSFQNRDVIFCDECHNVPNICQNFGSFSLDVKSDIKQFKIFLDYCKNNLEIISEQNEDSYLSQISVLYNRILETSYKQQNDLFNLLNDFVLLLNSGCLSVCRTEWETILSVKTTLTKREHKINEINNWINSIIYKANLYKKYSEDKKDYIVKCDNKIEDNSGNLVWPENPIVTFKFAREDIWVNEFILKHQNVGTVFLSATVGGHTQFDEAIGIKLTLQKKSAMLVIPSTFDFSKSPIYFIPGNKMSAEFLETSIVNNTNIISKILKSSKHCNQKGIIHTGSYKIAYRMIDLLDPTVKGRIHVYTDSKEKEEVMHHFEYSENGVLVGPGITEGVDFPDDGCRFNIFLKIPYPFMGDPLVRAKSALFPRWYNSQTTNNIIQGIGRGNRTPNDWCTTYILDGCFDNLYQSTRRQYPKEIQNRIHVLTNKK